MKIKTIKKIAAKSVYFQNLLLKRHKLKMKVIGQDCIGTQPMGYDTIDKSSLRNKFAWYQDYTRYRTFELVADEIRSKYKTEELSSYCVAEAGVFTGKFAWIINQKFNECEMYLYDTFEGFDKNDLSFEISNSFTEENRIDYYAGGFGNPAETSEQRIQALNKRLVYKDKCHIKKGYFPDSAVKEKEKRWIFVSLDMDLYKPMKEGIFYFWPNMVEGGAIFVHDYNNIDFAGIKQAVSEAEKEFGKIYKVPISDQGGTLILIK